MAEKVVKKCHKCGKDFFLGYDGVGDGKKKDLYTCDLCSGNKRDRKGMIIPDAEKDETYIPG